MKRARTHRHDSGYVLLVVMLLAGLTLATAVTYSHHAIAQYRESEASLYVQESRESASSGVAFARQSLAAAQPLGATALTANDKTISVEIADLGGDKRSILVEALQAGMGATVFAQATIYPTPGPELPTIDGAVGTAVLADAGARWVSGNATLTGIQIDGTLILGRGSEITLDDVIVNGTIVSEPALRGAPYAEADATRLVIRHGLRVRPSPLLTGCGIVMPDGTLILEPNARVEVHGALLADNLSLSGSGSLDSYVIATGSPDVPAAFDRPGWGRTPPAWPSVLQTGSRGLATLAFPRHVVPVSESEAIESFAFPAAK